MGTEDGACAGEGRRGARRTATAFALGALLGLVPAALRAVAGPPVPGSVAIWAVDRDGGALFGLDAELYVARRVPLAWPVRVAARADGGAWAAAAVAGRPDGPHALLALDADGGVARVAELGPVRDLFRTADGTLLVLDEEEESRCRLLVLELEASAAPGVAAVLEPSATCVAGDGSSLIVGHTTGALEPRARDGRELGRGRRFAGAVLDLAPARSGWWVLLAREEGARLVRLDAALNVRWATDLDGPAASLATVPEGDGRAWVLGEEAPYPVCVGPEGVVQVLTETVPLLGGLRGAATEDGGLLVAAPGAVLRTDPRGDPRPGQGGFRFLTDVDRVPER